jgi:hypothetical protein
MSARIAMLRDLPNEKELNRKRSGICLLALTYQWGNTNKKARLSVLIFQIFKNYFFDTSADTLAHADFANPNAVSTTSVAF